MEKLGLKLDSLQVDIRNTIETLLETKGVSSRFNSTIIVLVIHDEEKMFNLGSSNWLVEISEDYLIDNEGYQYGYDSLKLEDFCIAIDSIIDGITPKFEVSVSDENGDGVSEYFEDKAKAYEKFVQIQSKGKEVWLCERTGEFDRHGIPQYEIINEHLIEDKD